MLAEWAAWVEYVLLSPISVTESRVYNSTVVISLFRSLMIHRLYAILKFGTLIVSSFEWQVVTEADAYKIFGLMVDVRAHCL